LGLVSVFEDAANNVVFDAYTNPLQPRIWKWSTGTTLTVIAGPGTPVMDSSGNTIPGVLQHDAKLDAVAPNGQLFYEGGFGTDTSGDYGFWHNGGAPNASKMVFFYRAPVPGQPSNISYESGTGIAFPQINSQGHMVTRVELNGPNFDGRDAFMTDRSGSLQLLYKTGDQVPGEPVGVEFGGARGVINDNDDLAIGASLDSGPFTPVVDVIYREHNGQLTRVIATGDQLTSNRNLSVNQLGSHAMNNAGQIAFAYQATGPTLNGLHWGIALANSPGNVIPIILGRDPVPGGPAGSIIADELPVDFELNNRGQIAFESTLLTSPPTARKTGVFIYDPVQGVMPIALPGDMIQVRPGVMREIANAEMLDPTLGSNDAARDTFNDKGQLLFRAAFTDGTSGLFVSNAFAVPEPSVAACVCVLAVCGVVSTGRRRAWWPLDG
jgi:hypothetical protein